MDVSVESTGSIGRRMKVTLPAEELENAVQARLKRLSRQVKMPGFRPGKVPLKVVEKQYGGQAVQEAASDLIQASFERAVGQEGLEPVGGPKIEPKSLARGQSLEYVAEFDVYPEIKKTDLSGVTIEKPICEILPADIDRTIETMRGQRKGWEEVDRASREGDRVTIDFKGKIGDEYFEGGQAENYPLELGSGAMIAGFEDGIRGMKSGEEKTIEVKFPDDYRAEQLAGKTAHFEIVAKKVEEPKLPEVNDEFAAELGIDGGVDKLKEDVKENLERERTARIRSILRSRVMQALMDANDIEVPAALVEQEARRMKAADQQQRQAQGYPADANTADDTQYRQAAERRVVLGLVLAEIIKDKQLQADKDKVRERVEELAAGYEQPEAVVKWYYEQPGRLAEIENVVVEEQVVELLLETASVKGKATGFQDLVQLSMSGA